MYRSILVPTDGSALARSAIKKAVQLAKEQNAKLVGIYVAPPYEPRAVSDYVYPDFMTPRQYADAVKQRAAKHLDHVRKAAEQAGVSCAVTHAQSAYPYVEILKAARKYRCDLIFMASHGRRGISRLLLGSETTKVLAHSAIPVLVHRG